MKTPRLPGIVYVSFLLFSSFSSCSRKDITDPMSPAIVPVISIADSTFKILSTVKADINDYDIVYQVKPPSGESYANVFLQSSTSPDFTNRDSSLLAKNLSSQLNGKFSLRRLKQATDYFVRISVQYNNKVFTSQVQKFTTDTLKLLDVPEYIERGGHLAILTNFKAASVISDTSTHVFLDNISCQVLSTNGFSSTISVPETLPVKKYKIRFERNGIYIATSDTVSVLLGIYTELTSPVFPVSDYTHEPNALGNYGTCYSTDKGYLIGGIYFKNVNANGEWQQPNYILEFNVNTKTWLKKYMPAPRYFSNPVCHFYNNAIYIIGGIELEFGSAVKDHVRRMLRLDLGTMQWSTLDTLPFAPMEQQVSFEINGEWYIGLGGKFNLDYSTTPMKQFWKYNPSTNTWTRIADFPGQWQKEPTAFEINGKGYVFLGCIPPATDPFGSHSTTFTREFWEYDPQADLWRKINLPAGKGPLTGEKYSVGTGNGKAYFFTSQLYAFEGWGYDFELQESFLEYDPEKNTFSNFLSLSHTRGIWKVFFQKDGIIYFQGDQYGYTKDVSSKTFEFKLN